MWSRKQNSKCPSDMSSVERCDLGSMTTPRLLCNCEAITSRWKKQVASVASIHQQHLRTASSSVPIASSTKMHRLAAPIFLFASSFVATPSHAFQTLAPTTLTRTPTSTLLRTQQPLSALPAFIDSVTTIIADSLADAPPEVGGISYSKASYYTVLGLYLLSFPGVWSQVSRSTKAKVKRKTFESPGEKNTAEKAMSLRQQAGEIMACTSCDNASLGVCVYGCMEQFLRHDRAGSDHVRCAVRLVCVFCRFSPMSFVCAFVAGFFLLQT